MLPTARRAYLTKSLLCRQEQMTRGGLVLLTDERMRILHVTGLWTFCTSLVSICQTQLNISHKSECLLIHWQTAEKWKHLTQPLQHTGRQWLSTYVDNYMPKWAFTQCKAPDNSGRCRRASSGIVQCHCNWTNWFNSAVHILHDVVRCRNGIAAETELGSISAAICHTMPCGIDAMRHHVAPARQCTCTALKEHSHSTRHRTVSSGTMRQGFQRCHPVPCAVWTPLSLLYAVMQCMMNTTSHTVVQNTLRCTRSLLCCC